MAVVKPEISQFHAVTIAGVDRRLPLFEVKPGLRIAVLNILGDNELIHAAAVALNERLSALDYAALVTPETKSIPLAHEMAGLSEKRYVVLRKSYKSYMGDALSVQTHSITTGAEQTLYLDQKDAELIHNRRVVLIDDVVSSGSTLVSLRNLMRNASATIAGEAAIATEGKPDAWPEVIALAHLPLFSESSGVSRRHKPS